VTNLASLDDSLDDGVVFNVVWVVSLHVDGEPVKRALDGFLGSGVHHARVLQILLVGAVGVGDFASYHWRIVWHPRDEKNLVPGPLLARRPYPTV